MLSRRLCAGFGEPIGIGDLTALVNRRVAGVRQDLALARAEGHSLLDVIRDLEAVPQMHPLYIVDRIEQIGLLRAGTDAEWINEPDLAGLTPEDYAATATVALDMAARCGVRLWIGSVSNLSRDRQDWLRRALAHLPTDAPVAAHRYPAKSMDPADPQKGFESREQETAAFLDLIGHRPYMITEFGYHLARFQPGIWPCIRKRLSEREQADAVRFEWAWWERAGAEAAYLYQFQDGEHDVWGSRFGIRAYTKRWKAVAETFAEADVAYFEDDVEGV